MSRKKTTSLIIYLLLGGAVAFLVFTLFNWISAGMVNPIQMAIFIGVFLAFIFWVLFERSKADSN